MHIDFLAARLPDVTDVEIPGQTIEAGAAEVPKSEDPDLVVARQASKSEAARQVIMFD